MTKKLKDFVFSIVLILLGIYVIVESLNIYHKAAEKPYKITQFTISPGFLPFLLGIALTLTALILLASSFRGEKIGEALGNRKTEFVAWTKTAFNADFLNMTIGCVLMFIYTFFLVQLLPFWLASIIFLVAMFLFLRIGKPWKAVVLAVLVVALIVLLFKYGFGAAMPE
ncbi:MAG: tripartite tricarboxylate transporter TctB family protein [Oscillospiraceae bacterium]|nr:tripartite tricarboxylate transporter TctB family protein [Oscillospiraceae bacterium]